MQQRHTSGYLRGQQDYQQRVRLVYLTGTGALVWEGDDTLWGPLNEQVGTSATDIDAWGRDYHMGWSEAAASDQTRQDTTGDPCDRALAYAIQGARDADSEGERITLVPN